MISDAQLSHLTAFILHIYALGEPISIGTMSKQPNIALFSHSTHSSGTHPEQDKRYDRYYKFRIGKIVFVNALSFCFSEQVEQWKGSIKG